MAFDAGEVEATLRLRDELTGQLAEARKALDSFGASAIKVGGILTASLTLPIAAIGGASIKMAMDAVESENLFEVSFGKMAGAARDWSEQTAKALGLNQFELRKTSGMLYTMFDSMGIAAEGAFAMSTSMTKLAADMASYYNMRPDEAMQKLSAGITGEMEPLKRLGIMVDEVTVKAYAYKNGIAAMGSELSQQQKVLARYGSIMEQTAKAQGDLARTLDSPTNQLRIMKEQFNTIAITLGNALMPALQGFLSLISTLVPYIRSMAEWFGGLPVPVRMAALAIVALVAAIGPLLVAAGILATSFSAVLGLLGPLAISAATAGTATMGAAAGTSAWGGAMTFLYSTMLPIAAVIAAIWAAWKVGNIEGVKNTVAEWALRLQGFSKEAANAAVQGHAQAVAAQAQATASTGAKTATFDLDAAMKSATESAKKQAAVMSDNEKAQKEAAAAVKAHAKALKDLREELSGEGVIKQVDLLREALKGSIPIWQMTYDEQQKIHKAVVEAIDVYKSAGKVIPEDLLRIKAATENLAVTEQQRMSKLLEGVKIYHAQLLLLNDSSLAQAGPLATKFEAGAGNSNLSAVMEAAMKSVPPAMKSAGVSGAGSLMNGLSLTLQKNLGPTILSALQGGGNVVKSVGGMIGGELGTHFLKGATSMLTGAFGKTIGGTLGSIIPGLGTILGSQLGDFMMKGLSKVGSWFKGLFGGPSGAEKEGRAAAQEFRDQLQAGLTDSQKVEAGNEQWKSTIIAIRDAYIAAGHSGDEATVMAQRLFEAEKQGGSAVKAVIDEINGVMSEGLKAATKDATAGVSDVLKATDGLQVSVTGSDEAIAALGKTQETVTNLMLAGFDKLILKLDELLAKLSAAGALTGALGSQASSASVPAGDAKEVPGFAAGTFGKYLDFGTGTRVNLHGKEKITPIGSPESDAGGGGVTVIVQNVHTQDAGAFIRDLPDAVRRNRGGLRTGLRASLGVA